MTPHVLTRRSLVLAVAGAAIAGGLAIGTTHASAASGPKCVVSGTAHISPGLTTKAHSFTDTFSGTVSSCQGGGVKSGSVTESGSGNGSCASSKTAGVVHVRWNNGQTSTASITTTGVGSALKVTGSVTSGLFAGQALSAVLNFVTNPAVCAGAGASSLSFKGVVTA